VVVGEGRSLNFEMVEQAVQMILGGAKLVATNLDPTCPTQNGTRPGCGAIVAMLEAAAGVRAFSVGKPSPVMLRAARKELELTTDQTIVIGDTMETDILGGVQLGYKTILVLSGGTSVADLVPPRLDALWPATPRTCQPAGESPASAGVTSPPPNPPAPFRTKSLSTPRSPRGTRNPRPVES
jgi:ribonucleotide monophosphatase NagD (HAD superfamily)